MKAARAKELDFFCSEGVWLKVPRQRALEKTGGPPISVRWMGANKGDEHEPNYKPRLAAKQLKTTNFLGKSAFAPAPPLQALRAVISMDVTTCERHRPVYDPNSAQRMQMNFIDVNRA